MSQPSESSDGMASGELSPVPHTLLTTFADNLSDTDFESPVTESAVIFPINHLALHQHQQQQQQQQQSPREQGVYDHSLREPSTIQCPVSLSIEIRYRFLMSPIPLDEKVFCRVTRHRFGFEHKLFPTYTIALELGDVMRTRQFLMSVRKKKKSKSSTYLIYNCPLHHPNVTPTKQNVVGKVKSNFIGTEFVVYSRGSNPLKTSSQESNSSLILPELREELAVILYEPNLLGFKGPRKMTIVIPSMAPDGQRLKRVATHVFIHLHKDETLLEQMKIPMNTKILWLSNKSPQWNEETHSYVLNFNGRVTVPSVKNFQVVHNNDIDYIVMQFGRVGGAPVTIEQDQLQDLQAQGVMEQVPQDFVIDTEQVNLSADRINIIDDTLPDFTTIGPIMGVHDNITQRIVGQHNFFSMDLQYPMCLLQALGICLSSFDTKLACE